VRLLQQPDDLARLPQLRAEYDGKHRANKAALSATLQGQVCVVCVGVCVWCVWRCCGCARAGRGVCDGGGGGGGAQTTP
jgi:hypothetical protein